MTSDKQAKREVLDYVSSMLRQLRQMAKSQNQEMLAYLIDMAQIEATEQLAAHDSGKAGRKQRDSAA